nr:MULTISPECIES: hypothetical protein [Methylobacteriaceae]
MVRTIPRIDRVVAFAGINLIVTVQSDDRIVSGSGIDGIAPGTGKNRIVSFASIEVIVFVRAVEDIVLIAAVERRHWMLPISVGACPLPEHLFSIARIIESDFAENFTIWSGDSVLV